MMMLCCEWPYWAFDVRLAKYARQTGCCPTCNTSIPPQDLDNESQGWSRAEELEPWLLRIPLMYRVRLSLYI